VEDRNVVLDGGKISAIEKWQRWLQLPRESRFRDPPRKSDARPRGEHNHLFYRTHQTGIASGNRSAGARATDDLFRSASLPGRWRDPMRTPGAWRLRRSEHETRNWTPAKSGPTMDVTRPLSGRRGELLIQMSPPTSRQMRGNWSKLGPDRGEVVTRQSGYEHQRAELSCARSATNAD